MESVMCKTVSENSMNSHNMQPIYILLAHCSNFHEFFMMKTKKAGEKEVKNEMCLFDGATDKRNEEKLFSENLNFKSYGGHEYDELYMNFSEI